MVSLAQWLDPSQYEIHFAAARFDDFIFRSLPFARHTIYSISPATLERSLRRGTRLYSKSTLARYVRQELGLFDTLAPDLIVGDFRLSLCVSAAKAKIPFATMINAYWSPFRAHTSIPVPDHPAVRLLGESTVATYFPIAIPYVFAHFARPVNRLRRDFGLREIGSLLEVLTHGDYTLYPDPPLLAGLGPDTPNTHRVLGYVPWSPPVAKPIWWESATMTSPLVYVTLGSSGRSELLPIVVDAFRGLPISVLLSTAGRPIPSNLPPNIHAADYLPGNEAARCAALVVSNGGSSTGYQALAEGTPVVSIPFNLDQYLASQTIEAAGAGITLRSGSLTSAKLRDAILTVLADDSYRAGAGAVAQSIRSNDPADIFRSFVREVIP